MWNLNCNRLKYGKFTLFVNINVDLENIRQNSKTSTTDSPGNCSSSTSHDLVKNPQNDYNKVNHVHRNAKLNFNTKTILKSLYKIEVKNNHLSQFTISLLCQSKK
jgi:hypothetical protein